MTTLTTETFSAPYVAAFPGEQSYLFILHRGKLAERIFVLVASFKPARPAAQAMELVNQKITNTTVTIKS